MERLARLEWLASVANELSIEARVQYSYTPGGHIFCRFLKLLASSELLRTPLRNCPKSLMSVPISSPSGGSWPRR
jgi:hypothetical protein